MSAATAQGLQPDRAWWEALFAVLDAGDAAGFARWLTPDAQFRFGNAAPTITGAEVIRAAAESFFAAIGSSRHRLLHHWNAASTIACEGEVTYVRHDGSTLTVPFVDVLELRADRIASYRIYIDNSQLFASVA